VASSRAFQQKPSIWSSTVRTKHSWWTTIKRYRFIYLMMIPAVIWFFLFRWMTIYGMLVAFKQFFALKGIWNSPLVGWTNFQNVLHNPDLPWLIRNALIINFYRLLFAWPAPVILALLLNEIKSKVFKSSVQTLTYLPHFITWVVIGGIVYGLLQYNYGVVNRMLVSIGCQPVAWYQSPQYWRAFLIGAGIWKEIGWGTILYLAIIATNANPEIYEAAIVDGATRFQQIRHLTLPVMLPMVGFNMVFMVAGVFGSDVGELFALVGGNARLFQTVDTIDYFLFRAVAPVAGTGGVGGAADFGYGFLTALGILQAVVGLALFIAGNWAAKKFFRWSGIF